MTKKYQALICDVDGTLVVNHPDAMPSPAVTAAIKRIQKTVHVGIATGRPLQYAEKIIDHLGLVGPAILLGGSQIIDCQTKQFLYKQPIDLADVSEILHIVEKYPCKIDITTTNSVLRYSPGITVPEAFTIYVINVSKEQLTSLQKSVDHLPNVTTVPIVSWTPGMYCLCISHVIATKQHAILTVARDLHISPKKIVGVGDGPNDFPLLMACGCKVAMGNAESDLKEIADFVAPDVEHDGVATVIQKFFPEVL